MHSYCKLNINNVFIYQKANVNEALGKTYTT